MTILNTFATRSFLFYSRLIFSLFFTLVARFAFAWQDTGAVRSQVVRPDSQPTPYILYWGSIQSRIEYRPKNDVYTGEARPTFAALEEALRREPRLWNGRALEKEVSFVVASIAVRSRQNEPEAYAASKPALAALIHETADTIFQIQKLLLPNGRTADLRFLILPSAKNKLPDMNQPPGLFQNPGRTLHWGPGENTVRQRSYFTETEFWQIANTEPSWLDDKNDTLRADQYALSIFGRNTEMGAFFPKPDNLTTLEAVRESLQQQRDKIRPGAVVWINFYEGNTKDTVAVPMPRGNFMDRRWAFRQASQAVFNIVAPDDPRLELRNSDLKYFKFEWGSLNENFGPAYGRPLKTKTGDLLYADNFDLNRNYLSVPDLRDLLSLKPRLKIAEQISAGLEFDLLFKGDSARILNGIVPDALRVRIEKEAQPGDVLIFKGFKTQEYDLSGVRIRATVKYADPVQPLATVQGALKWGLFQDDFAARFMRDANGLIIWTGEMPRMSYYYFSEPEIRKIMATPPALTVDGRKVENLRFYLNCGAQDGVFLDENGLPDSIAGRWVPEIRYGGGCTLSGLRTDAADLRGMIIRLFPRREDRPFTGSRLRDEMPPIQELDLVIDPNPVRTDATFTLEFPKEGRAVFSVSNVFGQIVYEEIREQKGPGFYTQTLKTEFFKEKGLYYATLETPYGRVTKTFEVE